MRKGNRSKLFQRKGNAANTNPNSDDFEDDYAAFHQRRKRLPAARVKAMQTRYQAMIAKRYEKQRRFVNNVFQFWTVCTNAACKRREDCAGDPYACHERWWRVTAERHKVWYRAYVKARAEDSSPEQAQAHAEAEVKRLAEHIARVEAEQLAWLDALETAERAQATVALTQPLPREGGPRVRLL